MKPAPSLPALCRARGKHRGFSGMAAEARSCTCMKAYLVNAADPVLTVSIEFGIRETDPARAASIIVEHKKMGGCMVEWSLQHDPERFVGQDTLWNMDHILTWLPPNGDVTGAHVETLGNMISEAFHQHKNAVADKKRHDAKKEGKEDVDFR